MSKMREQKNKKFNLNTFGCENPKIFIFKNRRKNVDGIETAQNQNERASKVTSSSLISIDIFNFRFIFECSNFPMNEQQKKTTWFYKPI